MKIVNVQGRKKTGKTTTVTNIIAELCRRGYSVGSVKGIHIDGFTMDVEGEDTGKHKKAGANPVTARCHDETNIMFTEKRNLRDILKYYENDWVVIESHVDLRCPNIITGRTAEYDGEGKDVSLAEQVNELTIACSGVVSNDIREFRGLPVVNAITDIERLVDIIEASYEQAGKGSSVGVSKEDRNRRQRQIACIEPAGDFELIEENDFIKVCADGSKSTGRDSMLTENTVSIMIDGRKEGNSPCTPQYITELVIGWMNGEGFIDSMKEINRIEISENGTEAEVTLAAGFADPLGTPCRPIKPVTFCRPIRPVTPIPWKKEWIFSLAEDFEIILPLRKQTMAAHNCRLARGSEILFKCEDIGRHSAIDKVVGWAMRNEVDMTDCVLFTSGRVSRAMVQKAIRAGIPVMAGKGTISKRAVQLAREMKLTLIGYSKKDSLCIFTQPKDV